MILTSLSFQSVYNVERRDSLSFSMFGVCDGVSDNAFEKGL